MRTGVLLLGVVLSLASCATLDRGTGAPSPGALVGTWKLQSARYDGRPWMALPAWKVVKMITPGHFLWFRSVRATGAAQTLAYGTWTLTGDTYTEVPSDGNGSDFNLIRAEDQVFHCELVGDKWYHTGTLSDGTSVDEVWVRVP